MNYNLTVFYNQKPCYDIAIRSDFSDFISMFTAAVKPDCKKVCIISDSNVAGLYMDEAAALFENTAFEAFSFVFPAGEKYKKLSTIEVLYTRLIEWNFTRNDVLVALGGGVTGDMTGFAAATYLRGIDFVQLPTTLLAQVDSSIGGKTGVDLDGYKNMVGAFHMPRLVYMNLSLLQTLDNTQFECGMGEVIKSSLIRNSTFFEYLENNSELIIQRNTDELCRMVYECCQIKRTIVENDPEEKGERGLLNFGHTLGHAVEKLSDFSLAHGQCVSIGIAGALYLSESKAFISHETSMRIIKVLRRYNLPVYADDLNANDIAAATRSDKKRTSNGIKFVLLKDIGEGVISTDVSEDDIFRAAKVITGKESE